jgi:N utilization substance protein B
VFLRGREQKEFFVMGARRRAREAALQMLYCMDLAGGSAGQVEIDYCAHLASSQEGKDYAHDLVRGYVHHAEAIDGLIRKVSEHWRLERMPRVDRNILRLSAYELVHLADVPRRVTLNEAVELAKRYGSEGSAGFVNGVLDRIATDLGKG